MILWIFQIQSLINNKYGSINNLISHLKSINVNNVLLKYHEGASSTGGRVNFQADFRKYAPYFKRAGFKVGAWGYNYFNHVQAEADYIISALNEADYYVFDPEIDTAWKFSNARSVCQKVRAAHPKALIGYSSFPIVSKHNEIAYSVFNEYCDFASPQCYWNEMQWSEAGCINTMISDHKNAGLTKPIYPSIEGYRSSAGTLNAYANYGFAETIVWDLDEITSTAEDFIKNHPEKNSLFGCSYNQPNLFCKNCTTSRRPLAENFVAIDEGKCYALPDDRSNVNGILNGRHVNIYGKCGKYFLVNPNPANPQYMKITDLKGLSPKQVIGVVRVINKDGAKNYENPTEENSNGVSVYTDPMPVYEKYGDMLLVNGMLINLQWVKEEDVEWIYPSKFELTITDKSEPLFTNLITAVPTPIKIAPSTSYASVIGTLPANTQVNVYARNGDYFLISNTETKYVLASNLTTNTPLKAIKYAKIVNADGCQARENPTNRDHCNGTAPCGKIEPVYLVKGNYSLLNGLIKNIQWGCNEDLEDIPGGDNK